MTSTLLEHQETGELVSDALCIRYHDSGPRPTHDGRLPLIMVHGTSGNTQSHFGYLFPMLATRQRVISIDLSPPAGTDLSLAQLAAQVHAVAEQRLAGQAYTLLGYSLGAVIAAFLAGTQPQAIRQLVLVAGWMQTDNQQRLRNDIWRTLRDTQSPALQAFGAFCAFSQRFLAGRALDDVLAAAAQVPSDAFVARQMALNASIDIRAQVAAIRATTLIVGCTHDQMVPCSHSQQLFGAIEDARYAEIASGHAVVYERPAELFQLIDNFTRAPQAHPSGTRIAPPRP